MKLCLTTAVLTCGIAIACFLATSDAGPVPYSSSLWRRSPDAAERLVDAAATNGGAQLKPDGRAAAAAAAPSRGSSSSNVPSWIKELLVARQDKMPSRWFVSPNAQPRRTGGVGGGSRHPHKNIRPPLGVFRAPL